MKILPTPVASTLCGIFFAIVSVLPVDQRIAAAEFLLRASENENLLPEDREIYRAIAELYLGEKPLETFADSNDAKPKLKLVVSNDGGAA